MKKILSWIFAGTTLFVIAYLAVLLLNAGVILDNARSEAAYLRERSEMGLLIISKCWIGKSSADVSMLSNELKLNSVITGIDGTAFEVGDFLFEMREGRVVDVRFMDSPQSLSKQE